MNHEFTRAGGIWAADTDLLALELADLDGKTVDSISATGGIYSLNEGMLIGGEPDIDFGFDLPVYMNEGLSCFGYLDAFSDIILGHNSAVDMVVGATSTFDAEATFNGETSFLAFATFSDYVLFESEVVVGTGSGDNLTVHSSAFFNADAVFAAETTFQDLVTVDATLDVNGTCQLGDSSHSVQLNGATQVFKPIRMQSGGALVQRATIGADADTSYSPLEWHEVVILDGGISGNVDYTIDDTDCIGNEEIVFTNKDQTSSMFVKRPGGATIAGITGGWIRCKRIAGTWYGVQRGDITVN